MRFDHYEEREEGKGVGRGEQEPKATSGSFFFWVAESERASILAPWVLVLFSSSSAGVEVSCLKPIAWFWLYNHTYVHLSRPR